MKDIIAIFLFFFALQTHAQPGNINMPTMTLGALTEHYYYMAEMEAPYILRVKLTQLDQVADTIRVFDEDIRSRIFEAYYGDSAQIKMSEITELDKRWWVETGAHVLDMWINNDEDITFLLSVPTITLEDKKNGDTLVITSWVPAAVNFIDGEVTYVLAFNVKEPFTEANETFGNYNQAPRALFYLKDELLGITVPDTLRHNAPILAKFAAGSEGKLEIRSLFPYPVDSMYVDRRIGGAMLRKMYSEPFLADAYSGRIMNLEDSTLIRIPFRTRNDFTRMAVEEVTVNPKHQLISMLYRNDTLRVLFQDGSDLKLHLYQLEGKGYKLAKEVLVSDQYPQGYNLSLQCGADGLYMYNLRKRKIIFWAYADL